MKKTVFFLILVLSTVFFPCRMQEAQAIDPVTIAILAPIALKAAKIAMPYVLRGLTNGGKHLLEMGGDLLNILRLPLGVVQCTALVTFGQFSNGLQNIWTGFVSPFKFAWKTVIMPFAFCKITT